MAAKNETDEVTTVEETTLEAESKAPVEDAVSIEEETPAEEAQKKSKSKKTTLKAQVQVIFRDIYTGELRKPGDVIEITQKRFDEINSKKIHVKRI